MTSLDRIRVIFVGAMRDLGCVHVFSVEEFEGSRKRVDARVDEGQLDIWRR